MKIVYEYPPNYKDICKVFDIEKKKGIVFAYGDILYNPDRGHIDPALFIHEETHSKQQDGNPKMWWNRYLVDIAFRASQEIEAYQNQYRALKLMIKDRNRLNVYLVRLAKDMSSEQYGKFISYSEAMKVIKDNKEYFFNIG